MQTDFYINLEILGGLHKWAKLQFDMTVRGEEYNAYWSACES